MSNSDKLGMLPGFGWLADLNPWTALIAAWLITPGAMFVVGLLLESRLLPIRNQFLAFVPGDLFLGVLFALSVKLADFLPEEHGRWYQSRAWHAIVLAGAVVACLVVRRTLDAPNYTTAQMRSPTKLYHDFVLYAGYGYLLFAVGVPAVFLTPWSGETIAYKACALLALLAWLALVVYDGLDQSRVKRKAAHAHIHGWKPLWS